MSASKSSSHAPADEKPKGLPIGALILDGVAGNTWVCPHNKTVAAIRNSPFPDIDIVNIINLPNWQRGGLAQWVVPTLSLMSLLLWRTSPCFNYGRCPKSPWFSHQTTQIFQGNLVRLQSTPFPKLAKLEGTCCPDTGSTDIPVPMQIRSLPTLTA